MILTVILTMVFGCCDWPALHIAFAALFGIDVHVGAFVPVESDPAKVFDDALFAARTNAWCVDVFDSQNEGAVGGTRCKPGA
jgi:hypothetical protein